MLNDLAKSIRFDNASKGFDPTEGGINRYILLTISELCEAQDEIRDGHEPVKIYFKGSTEAPYHAGADLKDFPPTQKPEGFSVEVADAIIRLLDIAGKFEHDLEAGTAEAVDFENATIDDWLLGVVNIVSDMFNYDPTSNDFWFNLRQAIGTLFLLCERQNIMVINVVNLKLAYNRTRPPKHGRKF